MKLQEYLNDWLLIRSPGLAPRTVDQYRDIIDRIITPFMGSTRLRAVKPQNITRLLAEISAEGHTRTAELVYVLLRSAFAQAVTMRAVKYNPVEAVLRPRHIQKAGKAWNDAQIAAYLDAIRGHRHEIAFLLAILCGLRRGEICGLRWEDVDLTAGVFHVHNQRQRLANGQQVDRPPKSRAGIRDVPIPEEMLGVIRASRQLAGYVVPLSPGGLDQVHRRLLRRLELPYIRLHDLRHTMGTAAIRHGASMRALQLVLGHADYRTTANRYTHPDAEMLHHVIDCVTRISQACT